MNADEIKARGKAVIEAELGAIRGLIPRIDHHFAKAVEMLVNCSGRVVTTGVGKAGIVAHKIAATLSSTGTPSLFLHPAEGLHGDLGSIMEDDVVLALSNSGESDELLRMLPSISRIGAAIVAVVGNTNSSLAKASVVALDAGVSSEACPLGLAPTASTTAMLVLGDALAMAAMEAKGFSREDYAVFHPAGALGRRLTLRVSDLMRTAEQMAVVNSDAKLFDVMFAISKAGAGSAFLTDGDGKLIGLITDGDIRRAILKDRNALDADCMSIMVRDPLVIVGNPLAVEALSLLEDSPKRPGEAPVIDSHGRPVGLLMLKDILRTGLV